MTCCARRPLRVLGEVAQPQSGELLDNVRHGGSRQPGRTGELHLGEPAELLDRVDDPRPIGFAKRRLRPWRRRLCIHKVNSSEQVLSPGSDPP